MRGTETLQSSATAQSIPSDERPSASTSVTFELKTDQDLEKRGFRSGEGAFDLVYIGFGFVLAALGIVFLFGYLGGNVPIGSLVTVVGVAFAVVMTLRLRYLGRREVVAMRLNEDTLEFVRQKAPPLTVEWNDPSLKLNLAQFSAHAESVLPDRDARATHPQWVDVFEPPSRRVKLETTLPPDAFNALAQAIQNHHLSVKQLRVAFYWHTAPKSPGWLAYDVEGQLGAKRELNGRVMQVRGPAWKGVPED